MAKAGRRKAARGIPALVMCASLAAGQAHAAEEAAGLVAPSSGGTGPTSTAPSVLPATGTGSVGPDVRLGNLGDLLGGPTGQPLEPAERGWTLSPSLSLIEQYVTGQRTTSGATSNQFITTVQPSILVSGDTVRLHGTLSYAPEIEIYAPDGNQNQVAHNFNGRLLATLVPGALFLDLRGSAAVQAVSAGQAPSQTSPLSRTNSTQTYSFSASPYALHRFGDWGTGEIGGSLARTAQNALSGGIPSTLADATNQNVTTTSGHVAFATGEAFARYNATALAQATGFQGSGVLNGAHRNTATLDNGYALTRTITALATLGWESIHYAGSQPLTINDAIWNIGLRLEPNPDSTITLRYGHRDGLDSFSLDAGYQPTARTRIYARYSSGLTTQAEQLENALATSDLDSLGRPVDHTTGAPLLPVGNFFGTQNSLYKTTLASLTGVLQLDRDSLAASVNSQTQKLVSASSALGLAQGNTSGVYGTLTWSHELSETLQSTAYLQYGTQHQDGPPASDSRLLVASTSLSYALSPTLSGQILYSYTQNSGGSQISALEGGRPGGQHLVLLSLVKSF